jgi:hypothetical protein
VVDDDAKGSENLNQRTNTKRKADQNCRRRLKMTSNTKKTAKWKQVVLAGVMVLVVSGVVVRIVESSNATAASETLAPETFQTPAEAGNTLASAAKTGDQTALSQILGVEAKALLSTGDSETDKAATDSFASKYQQMNRWVEMTDGSRVLYIGADNFAFPVPLAKNSSGQWYFDAVAGAQEIRARDIGRNELLAIDACSALAYAQEIYLNSGTAREYAQRIISTPGKQDGLYWPAPEAQISSPLGHITQFPKSSLASSPTDEPLVIDGYTLRVLTAQGDDAPGGTKSYIANGRMTGGFAILATPVKYGETGIMTFMISREGIVYEQDLGPDTVKLAASITEYNPDENWSPVE